MKDLSNINTEKELQKCKDSPAYFYNNYCLVNGKKPNPITDEEFINICNSEKIWFYLRNRSRR